MAVLGGPRGLEPGTDSSWLRLGVFMVHAACQALWKAQSGPRRVHLVLLVARRRHDNLCQSPAPVPMNADCAERVCVCALPRARPAPALSGGHRHGPRFPGRKRSSPRVRGRVSSGLPKPGKRRFGQLWPPPVHSLRLSSTGSPRFGGWLVTREPEKHHEAR